MRCPLKGWFLDHWAIIVKREDNKYLTLQYHVQGLEIIKVTSLQIAKYLVARSSNATPNLVSLEQIGPSNLSVKQLIVQALNITEDRRYSFVTFNCRHFVVELLSRLELSQTVPRSILYM